MSESGMNRRPKSQRRAIAQGSIALSITVVLLLAGVRTHPVAGREAVGPASSPRAAGRAQSRPDTACVPCRDFYRYVNHEWLDTATIPPTAGITGYAYYALDRTLLVVKNILSQAAANTGSPMGSRTQKIGAFYASCMDSLRTETDGIRPIAPALAELDAVRTAPEVALAAARLQRQGIGALFSVSAAIDQKNSRNIVLVIAQGGLGLPDRDYYFKNDSAAARVRVAYTEFVAHALALAGMTAEAANVATDHVMAIESALAAASMTAVARRDPVATYHKLTVPALRALAPAVPWDRLFQTWHVRTPDSVIVRQPEFLTALDSLLDHVPASDWRIYLRARLLTTMSPNLSSAFATEAFRFSQHLSGVTQQPPRWQRCVNVANASIGELVGQAYVQRVFPPAAKTRMMTLVADLRRALEERIQALDWMSEPTKREALAKLASFHVHVGYPDKWKDYSGLTLDRGSFVTNLQRTREFEFDRQMSHVGTAPDPDEWMSGVPQVFDGLAGPLNTITFTAAAYQPPWFDPKADDATNYGALGAVIGHEMTHHFDDNGRRYDAKGNLRDWWAPEDAAKYNERAQRVVDQFNGYTVLDSVHLNGRFLLGENIADLGGLKIAYLAMEKAQARKPRKVIGGYTPEQRFFIGFARHWSTKSRPEYVRQRLATNGHAPDEWRVNGPLSNMPEFARAFSCKAGDPMVRPANLRAEIW